MLMVSTFVGLFAVANSTGQPLIASQGLSFRTVPLVIVLMCVVIAVACTTVVLFDRLDHEAAAMPAAPVAWAKVHPKPTEQPVTVVTPTIAVVPTPVESRVQLKNGQVIYEGFVGHWVDVVATAYSPTDPIDSEYHETKGEWRWITADGKTNVREEPFGIAVPRLGRVPKWPYGTKIIIPVESGYVPWRQNRVFIADDTGSMITANTRKYKKPRVDLRVRKPDQAITYGKQNIRIFIVDAELPGD